MSFPHDDVFAHEFSSGVFINRKYYYLGLGASVENQFNPSNRFLVLLAYCAMKEISEIRPGSFVSEVSIHFLL